MSLEHFFNPRSVAVIGASRTKGKVGYEVLHALIEGGFEGDIYPINPKSDQIEGLKCYPDIKSVAQSPDLAVVVVKARMVTQVIRDCGSKKIKAAIVIGSGFKESGPEGQKLEEEMMQAARRGNVRILGPNCIGLMSVSSKLNASFGGKLPKEGKVGYFSQSGSILAAMVDMAGETDLGFSKLVSIGNKADINELEMIKVLGEDDHTQVIAGYLETITDGDAFIRQAERVSRKKPILLLKAGVTEAGAKAANSHTGRLSGKEDAYECVFERAGVIRCESIRRQFDYARAFAYDPVPAGPRVAVIANAGGAGIMAADAIERQKLSLAKFTVETTEKLMKSQELTKAASINNPVDLLGDALASRYEEAMKITLDDENVDTLLVLLSPHAMTESIGTAKAVVNVARQKRDKPILACFLGAGRVQKAVDVLKKGRIPHYDCPESAVSTIQVMSNYAKWRNRPKRVVKLFPVNRRKVERIIDRNVRQKTFEVGETQTKEILQAYGFVTPDGDIATSAEQAASIAAQIGFPVVLKIWSPDIIHKTDVDGVKTELYSAQDVMDAFDLMMYRIPKKMPEANILGILVEKMWTGGKEVILGMDRDPKFGPLMMFGMGGRLVEVLEDVVFYPAPLTSEEAKEMLVSTKTYELLIGREGEEPVDIDAIAEALQRLSQLVTEFPQIKEIDINPYVVGREGTTPVAVDAMMRLEDQ